MVTNTNNCRNSYNTNCSYPVYIRIPLAYRKRDDTSRQRYCYYGGVHYIIYCFMHSNIVTIPPKEIKMSNLKSNEYGRIEKKLELYLQPIITQYFIDNKSEIWLLFLIAHSKR